MHNDSHKDPTSQDAADILLKMAELYSRLKDTPADVEEPVTSDKYEDSDDTPMTEVIIRNEDDCPFCDELGCACENCPSGECPCPITCMCPARLDALGPVTAAGKGPCWEGYKQVGMKKGKNGNMVPNCVPIDASDATDTEFAKSRRAPKKDRIYGSKKNKPGSASGGKSIQFSAKVEKALGNKVREHNEKASPGRKATLPMLKAVYRRGSGAFSSSHRPGKTRDQWAMARVNAFLKLLRSGRPANPNYKQDNDLLPKAHPRSSRGEASLIGHELLEVALKSADEYGSPEHAIYSMAEYTGLGYEVIPALRGAWLRGVRDGDVPFQRAYELATNLYNSKDSDLLPKKRRQASGE